MSNWPSELMAECHRQRIREEMKQIHLERLALKFRAYPLRFCARIMVKIANWMISTGVQLRERYEASVMNWNNPSTSSM